MWNDIETTTDYLHFSVITKTVAELIVESGDEPISIGVSGSWGAGKSSMVKMIGKELRNYSTTDTDQNEEFIFLEFNAWLYQGYEDAKSALLQVVSQKLEEELKNRKLIDSDDIGKKFKNFVKRINWFQVAKISLPIMSGLIPGVAPFGSVVSAASAIKRAVGNKREENGEDIQKAYEDLTTDLDGVFKDENMSVCTPTQQIEGLRTEFEEILQELNIRLVVLVDDLDRCLPETAISTLEAMRLLLFVKRTAFIIAADEQMIRNGVKAHFGNADLSEGLVTSYFDKLIQVPITVPRLGVPEIKVYMVLLFLEQQVRKNAIEKATLSKAKEHYDLLLSKAWDIELSKEMLMEPYSDIKSEDSLLDEKAIMNEFVGIADQISGILVTADSIKGNPRLIKRFLNALEIRKKIAELNGITADSSVMIKMLLFERCASSGAFDYLAKSVAQSEDGKPDFLKKIEENLSNSKDYSAPDSTWNNEFVEKWLLMKPRLSEYDLRPLLHLSKDKSLVYAAYAELTEEGNELLGALKKIKNGPIVNELVEKIKAIGEQQAELLLNHIITIGRGNQWDIDTMSAALHITDAFNILTETLTAALSEIPAKSRKTAMIPLLSTREWAKDLLNKWNEDDDTPSNVKKAINQK